MTILPAHMKAYVDRFNAAEIEAGYLPSPALAALCASFDWVAHVERKKMVPVGEIAERLFAAIRTLDSLPDKERGWLHVKSHMPDVVQDRVDAWALAVEEIMSFGKMQKFEEVSFRDRPSRREVDRCLPTMSWLKFISRRGRKLCFLRAYDCPWWKIAGKMGRSERTVQRWLEDELRVVQSKIYAGDAVLPN